MINIFDFNWNILMKMPPKKVFRWHSAEKVKKLFFDKLGGFCITIFISHF